MATTTNYGWTTPDNTALVKDGASAIRTLGSSIDTTTKNLNPSTTLGDIEYRSSTANTNTRLGIGSTGQVLTVSGGVPAWATPAVAVPSLNEQVFTSSGSFTVPTGVTRLWVEILSGGGSGGRENDYSAGGGTAGGRINRQFTVTPAASLTVTIGAGGAARSTRNDGANGTASSFDGVSAEAGEGGLMSQASNLTGAAANGGSAWGAGKIGGGTASANSGAGGGGYNSGAGGSGRVIVRWLA